MNVLASIIENASKYPDRLAFVSRSGQLTYKELVNQARHLASWLIENHSKEIPVAVYGHMQPEMLVCFMACVLSGRAYVPIDESTPIERVKQILTKSETKLLFCSTELNEVEIQQVDFEEMKQIAANSSSLAELQCVSGDDVFYIIFTSGSTGMPKGVQVTADNLDSFVNWMVTDYLLKPEQVFLNQAPFSFDLSVMDLYPSLAVGGTIYAVDKDLIANPKDLYPYLAKGKLNVWVSTPSFMEMVLLNKELNENMLPEMETFLFCGETLPHQTAVALRERFPKAKVINTFGPTEATVAVTGIDIDDHVLSTYEVLPIGYCKKDCRILILDENGKEAETGEIVIVGNSVSKGYFNDQDKTEAVFYEIEGKRAYRTGDKGTSKEGLLFYHGRLDFQIKLHGYRMELEDIEASLKKIDLIQNVVVVPIMKENVCQFLTAVTVVGEHQFEKEFQLTSHIKKQLANYMPAYMIPRQFVYREQLSMTNNGKVDRKQIATEVQQ